MSFIANMFDSSKGNGFQAQGANITPGTNQGAIDQANQQTQSGLSQQQQFVNALGAQNGIQNQSQVYNQLQNIASGQGPNPAMAALANATSANTSNQAALMASQRGTGANAGMIARQAAQQGAANQQNAIGQGAALQAQQSLGAIGQAGQMAGQQVGQQAGAIGTYNQLAQNNAGIQQGALQAQNNANVAMQGNINNANAGIANTNAQNQNKMGTGLLSGLASGAQSLLGAEGGLVPHMAEGGMPGNIDMVMGGMPGYDAKTGGASFWNSHLNGAPSVTPISQIGPAGGVASQQQPDSASQAGQDTGKAAMQGIAKLGKLALMAKGGAVPAMLSPGERYLPPEEVKKVAAGKKSPIKAGEKIPGKPKFKGNDYRNDVVPKTLKEGGIVLPNEVMQSKHPHWAAHRFVSAIMAKQGLSTKKVKAK